MAGIFLSWSAPDVQAVDDLKSLLKGLNVPLWEYRDGMVVGQQIHASVLDAIEDSIAMIVCFSDATADREWLQRETDWAYLAYGKDPTRILPVWVGPHPAKKRPAIVRDYNLSTGDLTSSADREKFVREVLPAILGLPEPLVVPAALFAMDKSKSAPLFERLEKDEAKLRTEMRDLCKVLGMSSWPELLKEWSKRYGDTVEEFSPFADQQPLVKVVQQTVDAANEIRRENRHRPVFIRWLLSDLRGDLGEAAYEAARDRWEASRPLLIVDSISTLDDDVRDLVNSLPDASAAILWIPPYTLHTSAVESLLRDSTKPLRRIDDAFRKWAKQSDEQLAFDTPTSLSVRLWLHRTIVELRDENPPVVSRVSKVQQDYVGPKSLKGLTTLPRGVPPAFGGA